AILDADKAGFLRSETALIQTIGRAARHVEGKVIMYADQVTDAMKAAIDETNRRRAKQVAYNEEHGIIPVSIIKAVRDLTDQLASSHAVAEPQAHYRTTRASSLPKSEMEKLIKDLEEQMNGAAQNLEFEKAAALRDQIYELREVLVEEGEVYAIETFASTGSGNITDLPNPTIYQLLPVRVPVRFKGSKQFLGIARKEYKEFPFAERWLAERMKHATLKMAIKELKQNGALFGHSILAEEKGEFVSQHEHTVIITEKGHEQTT
ncbi:MAG: UvrB/UvrC motif-containing protein, partial [Candidatus Thorarchaeota archaeon]